MENFIEVHNFIKSVLIVALSEEIGVDESGILLPSEKHLREINDVIKGVVIDNAEKDILDYKDDEEIVIEGWTTWAENVYDEAQESARNSHSENVVNAYYNPEAAKKIKSHVLFTIMDRHNEIIF